MKPILVFHYFTQDHLSVKEIIFVNDFVRVDFMCWEKLLTNVEMNWFIDEWFMYS